MEITMNGTVYQFNFGMGFLREVNSRVQTSIEGLNGEKRNIGLQYLIAGLFDNDMEALVSVLDAANKGCEPRVSRNQIDAYIDNEIEDIDELFQKVIDFLSKTNATKKAVAWMKEQLEAQKTE